MRPRALLALAAAMILAAPVSAEPLKVFVDQTVALKIEGSANSVVLGNAAIADVAVHDPRTLLVTGKTFGSTNLMVIDGAGRTIYSNMLAVSDNRTDQLRVITRDGSQTYSCVDKCRLTPAPGGVAK